MAYFPSYHFLEEVVLQWKQLGVIEKLLEYKLLFIETKNIEITSVALTNYKAACDVGRGAVFLSVARGKVAEGIDFHEHYGRAVMMIGVPFLYFFSHQINIFLGIASAGSCSAEWISCRRISGSLKRSFLYLMRCGSAASASVK